ncbi:hypothetical protein [Streptomyces sp. NPDC008092]|uniref:hypothetical protein n=1 Tax=Streptomyces sp. NPDC008092 TaxID=3364808 RepID=UPI0036E45AA0
MNDQQPYPPRQPGWGGPQQPYGVPPFQPQPPRKKPGAGKIVGLGCLGLIGVFVAIVAVGAAIGGSGSKDSNGSDGSNRSGGIKAAAAPTATKAASGADRTGAAKTAVFKVWGSAPAGALGGLDITYGSDTDTRKGTFENGRFEATLPLKGDAMYFHVMAQLQGSGDINCSVTTDGKTKKAHASGGYNICDAQLNSDFTGGWR